MGLNINVAKNILTSDIFRHVAHFYIPMDFFFVNIVSLFSLFLRMQDSSQLNLSLTIWEFRATAAFVIIGLQRMFQM